MSDPARLTEIEAQLADALPHIRWLVDRVRDLERQLAPFEGDVDSFIRGFKEMESDLEAAERELADARAEKDKWQRDHNATWQRLTPAVRSIYMREYRAALGVPASPEGGAK